MNVLTIGEAMVVFAASEPGAIENIENFNRYSAGAEMNVAIGLSRLGLNSFYATKLGEDTFGVYIKSILEKEGIKTDYIVYDENSHTGFMLKEKALNGTDPKVHYYRKNSAASKFSKKELTINFENVDHVHLSGVYLAVSEDSRECVFHIATEAKKRGIPITFDPNLRPLVWNNEKDMIKYTNALAALSDVFMPGINEGKILTGLEKPEEIAAYYHNIGVKKVIIKLGEQGAFAQIKDEEPLYVKGFTIEKIVDTVGAGDGFAAGVVYSLVRGFNMKETLTNGNAIGALQLTCESDNEALPNREELNKFKRK
ncbi:MAG: sugar kinase [Defluviitaleaceae bacterium]|nr:sugar kinase [Defluviitaleaceae bacterium]